jgi:O-antigen/teichoic acid export membrane protein
LSKPLFDRKLISSTGTYTVSRIVNAAIPFLLMPVLTRYLTPTDYGIIAMFSVLLGIVTPFVGLSLHGAVSVRYFDKDEKDLPKYIGNVFFILTASTAAVSIVVWLFAEPIGRYSAFPERWLWTVVFVAASQFAGLVLLTLWQVELKAVKYGVFQNLQTLANVGLTLLLVVGLGMNWQGRIQAQVITMAAFALAAFVLLRRNGRLKFAYDRAYVDSALRFGIPLIPHALGGMLIVQTDRMFLTNMAGVATAGIYTVGYQFGSVIELLSSSFNQAYAPWLFDQLSRDEPGAKRRIVKLTYACFGLIVLLAAGLSLAVPWFLTFFVGKEFVGAGVYVFWIALGYACNGMYYLVANYIFYAGKTAVLAWVTAATAALNIAFNYFLIKLNGPVGAAQASAIAFFLSFVLTWILSARVYAMPWNLRKGS